MNPNMKYNLPFTDSGYFPQVISTLNGIPGALMLAQVAVIAALVKLL